MRKRIQVGKVIEFNPRVPLKRGEKAKKVPMGGVIEFQKNIEWYEDSIYNSGPKFMNGDTIVAKITPSLENGKTAFVDILDEGEMAFGSSEFFVLRSTEYTTPEFVYYFARSPLFRDTAISCMEGTSGRQRVNENTLKNIEFPFPSLAEQEAIANLLSNLDSKIELNNQINQQLEEMAKTIYDYWFVQFDFPNEEGKPYKSSGGKMVYNKQLRREIPEGWEAPRIKDWIKESKSGDWGKEIETGNYVVPVTCIRGADLNGLNGTANLDAPDRFILKRNKNKILDSHDLIIEISGGSPIQSTGRMAFLIDESLERFEHPLICSNFSRAASLKNKKTLFNFAFQWKHYYDLGVFFNWEGRTTGIKNLLFDIFISSHSFILPEENIMNQFYDTLSPMYKQIQKNLIQNQNLASLRDWLLPMLVNGQVTVRE